MSVNLGVEIDGEVFGECRTMAELIGALGECRRRFVIPESVCRRYKFNLEWSYSIGGLSRLFLLIYGFVMNTPSDRNILGIAYE